MHRETMLQRIKTRSGAWDMIIVGGGATGLGTALDAAARGYEVLLLERSDFAKGTSSRSTKLVHGGVRYLQQGNVSLVMEALKERGRLLKNAPHLVSDVAFIVPSYKWWESPFYGVGMKVYDLLAGRYGFGKSSSLSKEDVIKAIPSIQQDGLLGGTQYYDGQFDDARLAINLATTAYEQGATLVNYAAVTGLLKSDDGQVEGVRFTDAETGEVLEARGGIVINATGPFADDIRRMDQPESVPMIAHSQGVHIVLDKSFIARKHAIMVPHTDDGRVMFAIPWHDVSIIGTTDTPVEHAALEPVALKQEVEFILATANRYLAKPAAVADIKSVFAGIRPLVKANESTNTAAISRDHTIHIDPRSGLLTVAGGKWTTYRKMAEDVVDQAAVFADLPERECMTYNMAVHGAQRVSRARFAYYGSDANHIEELILKNPELGQPLDRELDITPAQVIWACLEEMARTVDDVLSRRTRCLLLDCDASVRIVGKVAEIMATELGGDDQWVAQQISDFQQIAASYSRRNYA